MASILHFILFFMVFNGTLAGRNRFLDQHYNKTRGRSDKISYPNRRKTQLYSRNSGRHVQILIGGKVVAKGDSGDKFAGLVILTNSYGRVRIKGLASDRYLCFDKRGHLISKKRATTKCIFRETFGKDAFTEYESANVKGKFLAFGKKGNARFKGRIRSGTKAVQFVERPKPEPRILRQNRYYRENVPNKISPWIMQQHQMRAEQSKKDRSRLLLRSKDSRRKLGRRWNKGKRRGERNYRSWKTEKKLKKFRRGRKKKKSSGRKGRRNSGEERIRMTRGQPRYVFYSILP